MIRVWAPHARRVELITDGGARELRPAGDGWHEAAVDLGEGDRYAFALDGSAPLPDPRSTWQPEGVHGRSAVEPAEGPPPWAGRDLGDTVIYELHVGAFTPEGTFDAAIGRLDHLVELGVGAIELMPIAEFPGERGWGYDGVDLYAAHHAYGGPQALDRLVAACHERGLGVIVDVVYNHLGPDGNHLRRFGPYFTVRHQTPWGEGLNYDGGAESRAVRDFVIGNTLHWLDHHGADGVRLDAVQAVVDLSATHVVEELVGRVDELERRTGRRLWVIAESDLNDPKVVTPRDRWGWGCDAQWSDDLHHSLHALLTGERTGYYGDFGSFADLAKALRDAFVYDGRASGFRRAVHGRPAGDLLGHRFLAYSQDHDQVGNRARGERLSHLVGTERALIAAAVVLLSPYVPMLFMGEEWASSSPFQYFTDHTDPALAQAVREGRRREFAAFGWDPQRIPDPQSPDTFRRSKLVWDERAREPHRRVLEWYRALLALRRRVPELRDGRRDLVSVGWDEEGRWLRLARGPVTLAFALERGARVPVSGSPRVHLASREGVELSSAGLRLPPDSAAVLLAS